MLFFINQILKKIIVKTFFQPSTQQKIFFWLATSRILSIQIHHEDKVVAASCNSLYSLLGSILPILWSSKLNLRIVPGQSAADVASEDDREARANNQSATADVETGVWMTTEYLSVRFDICFTVIKMEKNYYVCLREQNKAFDLDALSGDFLGPLKSYQIL